MKYLKLIAYTLLVSILMASCGDKVSKEEVKDYIIKVNDYWQKTNPTHGRAFWDNAAYHTGNIAAYDITGKQEYLDYSTAWAERNAWQGARSEDKERWRYSYGESQDYVLFGDWQICFQTYIDLYTIGGQQNPEMIARAREVMEYQMSTDKADYWWWADGLYMVMPVMTKLYNVTGNALYLDKLYEYFSYAQHVMYDEATGLFFRDGKYVYPKHKSANGLKDFWARGDGWVFAGLAKIIQDMPADYAHRSFFIDVYKRMAVSLKEHQQEAGYWTRSIMDPAHAPGPETSGTAFFTYGYLWGMNNGVLDKKAYADVVAKSWQYLTKVALNEDGKLGYVQPIGERAIPGQRVDENSSANFGVGAFLLAASEMYKALE